ncbi:hypothetical protein PLESTF_000317500 [Pleodorina starrii]|nr:hypothetical protein PLESTF_000317500 [Pleodorina starrii]
MEPAQTAAQMATRASGRATAPRKGQSDGAWREAQDRNPNKWQLSYSGAHPWAVCQPADASAGEVHDTVCCRVCSLWRKEPKIMACRSETLKAHGASLAHQRAVERSKAEEASLALKQRKNATLEQFYAPGTSKAETARLQQLTYLFHLLSRGRPVLDYIESEKALEKLGVPNFSSSHWSSTAGWQLAEALDGVLLDKVRELVQGARFVAIGMDECVGIDKYSRLSLHVYFVDAAWNRVPLFLDVAHLWGTPNADNITQLVLNTLSVKAGLGEEELPGKLVACSTDGTSLMTGNQRGVVATQVNGVVPFSVGIHCMAHRTSLAAAALEKAPVVKAVLSAIREVDVYFSLKRSFERGVDVDLPDRAEDRLDDRRLLQGSGREVPV